MSPFLWVAYYCTIYPPSFLPLPSSLLITKVEENSSLNSTFHPSALLGPLVKGKSSASVKRKVTSDTNLKIGGGGGSPLPSSFLLPSPLPLLLGSQLRLFDIELFVRSALMFCR
jgi:hypothetical protein